MKRIINLLTAAALSSLLSLPAYAAPMMINYQGRLIGSDGNPLGGTHDVLFSIYDGAGSLIWSETHSVTPDNGIFNVALGSFTASALEASDFAGDDRYLEIKIGTDAPLSPRTRLLSVPYAVYAANIGSPANSITVSTHLYVSGGQLRFGNIAGTPPTNFGRGSAYYNTVDNQIYYYNGTSWVALAAGGLSPITDNGDGTVTLNLITNKVGLGKTPEEKLDVAGNIKAQYGLIAATASLTGYLQAAGYINASSAAFSGNLGVGGVITAGSGAVQITDATGNLDATKLTGNLPALNGSALTGITVRG